MSTAQIKKDLHKYVDTVDTPFLYAVYNLMKVHMEENTPVGYNIKGEPISAHQLKIRVKAAQARMDKGEFTSQEELEKEAASW